MREINKTVGVALAAEYQQVEIVDQIMAVASRGDVDRLLEILEIFLVALNGSRKSASRSS